MFVQCPKCKTTYKVADEVVQSVIPTFRCSRCKHTFELEPHQAAEKPPAKAPPRRDMPPRKKGDDELKFNFPPKQSLEASAPAETPAASSPALAPAPLEVTVNSEDQWSLGTAEAGARSEPSPVLPEPPASDAMTFETSGASFAEAPATETEPARAEMPDNILPLDPYRDQQASIAPYCSLFALLAIAFALAAALHQAYPKAAEAVVKEIPFLGPALLKNNYLKDGVILQSLRGSFQSIQGTREVFVVSGVALNQNPATIRAVRVKGQAFDHSGKVLEAQIIWLGNAISPKITRAMTAQEVANLQILPPLRTFEVPPGDSIPFTIVFLKAPRIVTEFSCEIVSADGDV